MRAKFCETLKIHDYITGDFAGVTEETYLLQTRLINKKRASSVQPTGTHLRPSSRRQCDNAQRFHTSNCLNFRANTPNTGHRDLFQSVIGADTSILDVEKLHYLKASLKGEAETLVRNLTTISENYQRAWRLLIEQYENKQVSSACISRPSHHFPR